MQVVAHVCNAFDGIAARLDKLYLQEKTFPAELDGSNIETPDFENKIVCAVEFGSNLMTCKSLLKIREHGFYKFAFCIVETHNFTVGFDDFGNFCSLLHLDFPMRCYFFVKFNLPPMVGNCAVGGAGDDINKRKHVV